MIFNELQHKNSEENIIKIGEDQKDKKDEETKGLLFKLINEIIIGTFSSYEGTKGDFVLINTKYFQFRQYFTYNQNIGYLCGFHSLFNIYYFLQYLTSKEINQKKLALFNLKNAWNFWSFYKESINFLLTNLKLELYAEKSLKNEGPLERYQFVYLLNEFPKMKILFNNLKINYDISFTKFLFGFGIFNGTIEEGIDFQNKIDKFLDNSDQNKEKILIILLGIVNHWNILILHKNLQQKIDIYLLDSRNSPEMFNSIELYDDNNEKENQAKIVQMKEEYINKILNDKLKNKKITEWYITCWKEWYDSMNKSIILIFKILYKKINLLNYIIENKINQLINNFISKTNVDLIKFGNDKKIKDNINNNIKDRIIKWIKEEYHPAVFNDEIINDIRKVKYSIKEPEFISWIKLMNLYLNEMKDDKTLNEMDKDIILRYLSYINDLDKLTF